MKTGRLYELRSGPDPSRTPAAAPEMRAQLLGEKALHHSRSHPPHSVEQIPGRGPPGHSPREQSFLMYEALEPTTSTHCMVPAVYGAGKGDAAERG